MRSIANTPTPSLRMMAQHIRVRSRQQPRQQPRQHRVNRLSQETTSPYLQSLVFAPSTRWMLLPPHLFSPHVYQTFDTVPYGLTWVYTTAATFGESPFMRTQFRARLKDIIPPIPQFTPAFKAEFLDAANKNQTFRWRMKRLIHNWRVRRIRQANTEDLVTCEAPTNPISITDWVMRRRYTFEASTLFNHFRSKLTQASWGYPAPSSPTNPYTNEALSLGQIHFVIQSLREKRKTDWILETFVRAEYSAEMFHKISYTNLRLHALQRKMLNKTDDDAIDMVYDFMQLVYETQSKISESCPDAWLWLLEKVHEHPRLDAWRKLCYEYERGQIMLFGDAWLEQKKNILERGAALVNAPMLDIIRLWRDRPRERLDSDVSGSLY